ncbi:MAG: hypothetical protein JXQ90_10075 [Cyclobacteriaceae bacterium]
MNSVKTTALLIVLLLLVQVGLAQETYYVLHVNGQVSTAASVLKPKDKVLTTDLLQFSSESAFAVVFSSTAGRKIVRPVNKSTETQSELAYFLNENLFPVQNQLSTRGGDALRSFNDVKDYFATPVLVVDQLSLTINTEALGINENNVFSITANEAEALGSYVEDQWIVSLDELAAIDGHSQVLNFKDASFGSQMPICDINLILKTSEELKEELSFYRSLTNTVFDEASLKDHLETIYGRFDPDLLKQLLE